jgi:NAD(P)-dependent dehydrogenase (short-subunit alcohol dehydrogenase family)
MSMIDFTGQVEIVTGAGRGLGRLYALEIARRAGSVVNDLGGTMHREGSDSSVAHRVVEEIERAGGVAVASHESVASSEGGEAIGRTAVDRFGRLDAVMSNAGIFNSVPFGELSQADWRRILSVHLDGGCGRANPACLQSNAQFLRLLASTPADSPVCGQLLAQALAVTHDLCGC